MFENKEIVKGCAVKVISDNEKVNGLIGLVRNIYEDNECAVDFGKLVYSGNTAYGCTVPGEGLVINSKYLKVVTLDEMSEEDRDRILALIDCGNERVERRIVLDRLNVDIVLATEELEKLNEKKDKLVKLQDNYIEFYKKQREMVSEVLRHSKVHKGGALEYENGFYFITENIIATATNGGRYNLGAFRVDITFDNKVSIFNERIANARRGYWSETDVHPHVNYKGEPCLGSASDSFICFLEEKQYYFAVDVIISFLEQINLDDCAGRYAMNWDRLDDEGNVIRGHVDCEPEHFVYDNNDYHNDAFSEEPLCECSNCGGLFKKIDMTIVDNEEYCEGCLHDLCTYCEYCQEYHEDDFFVRVKGDNEVCENELEDNYYWCDECGNYVHEDDWVDETEMCCACTEENYKYCEGCGKYVKNDDFVDDTDFCYDCTIEEYTYCDECGEWIENSSYDFDKDMCNDCVEREYAECDGCGEYVDKFDIEPLPNGLYVCPDCVENYNDKQEETREI